MQLPRAIILTAIMLLSRSVGAQTTKELHTLADIYSAIRVCWKAPNISGPAELVVRLSFTRDGKILGKAHVTYEAKTVSAQNRLLYRMAVINAFKQCTPFLFSPDLGDAIAGRPINFRFRNNLGLAI